MDSRQLIEQYKFMGNKFFLWIYRYRSIFGNCFSKVKKSVYIGNCLLNLRDSEKIITLHGENFMGIFTTLSVVIFVL